MSRLTLTFAMVASLAACTSPESYLTNASAGPSTSDAAIPGGTWTGTILLRESAAAEWTSYPLTVDFAAGVASSGSCSLPGTVTSVTATEIQVAWGPDQKSGSCAHEAVVYSIDGGTLTAAGSQRAYSNDRIIQSQWNLQRVLPTSKDECKNAGWQRFGFPNQGQCVAFVTRH
jgi:hypothetical protein